ncbi:unnamed protein product [Effrenium voratum]|nr:unnamed protein product [Effrenium voratum]
MLAIAWYSHEPLPDAVPEQPRLIPTELSQRLSRTFDAGEHCDVQFHVGAAPHAECIGAHRIVLRRNPALGLEQSSAVSVALPNLEPEAVRQVLRAHYLEIEGEEASCAGPRAGLAEVTGDRASLEAAFGALDASGWAPLKAAVNTSHFADVTLELGGLQGLWLFQDPALRGAEAMLETLLARYLGKFLKGFTPEHISAHLLKGSVRLKEVDLDLAALTELLAEHLPCALQLRAVRCRAVALKVPWKRLRHKPVVVELSDVLVQAQVLPEELRAPQDLRRGQSNQPQEEVNIEEAEDEKKVEAQLKVGLKEVVGDGLQVLLNGLQVELFCEEGEISPLRLSVEAVHTFPCTVAGEKIDKPQDVYEFCDPCARLLRLVQVEGLRLETVDRGALVDLGAIRVQIEQRRWCGFIPQHRARRVCPFSSETTVSIRLDNVTLDLPLPAVKAVCSAPASAPSAQSASGADLCTWTAAQPGRGAATGLEWREQVVGRKTATLLSLGLTLAQCRAGSSEVAQGGRAEVSLFLGTSSAALEAADFMFTLDLVSSLDAFRRRCLAELGLEPDEEFRGAAQALQRLFGIYLGSARLTWTEGTPTTLLALSGAPSVTFRWKDVFGVSESSQPIEGCIHNVQILVDVNAFPRLVEIVKDIALPFAELLEPPPFATSWCRVQLHQLQLELPAKEGAGGGSPLPKITVALPSLLVTSLGGLGELFTSLESLPRHAWQSTRDEDQSTGDLEVVEPEPCACGRQLGRHCFGAGLAPLRGLGSQRAWRARRGARRCKSSGASWYPLATTSLRRCSAPTSRPVRCRRFLKPQSPQTPKGASSKLSKFQLKRDRRADAQQAENRRRVGRFRASGSLIEAGYQAPMRWRPNELARMVRTICGQLLIEPRSNG